MEEQLYALDSIANAIRNQAPFGLTRILSERVGKEGWALFRLDNNSSYDDTLPQWNDSNTMGNFYAFFWNVPQGGMSARDKCIISEMDFFDSDANAARWAFELSSRLTPETDVTQLESVKDDIPF